MNAIQTTLLISSIVISVTANAALTNCGSLASDYNGAKFNDEVAFDAGDGSYPVRYQFQSTSQYEGNVSVFSSNGNGPVNTITGTYVVLPSRITSLGVTHGQVGVYFNVQPNAITYFCAPDDDTGCLLTLSLTPTCSALGVVKQLSGDRLRSIGGAGSSTARSLNAQNWTR